MQHLGIATQPAAYGKTLFEAWSLHISILGGHALIVQSKDDLISASHIKEYMVMMGPIPSQGRFLTC